MQQQELNPPPKSLLQFKINEVKDSTRCLEKLRPGMMEDAGLLPLDSLALGQKERSHPLEQHLNAIVGSLYFSTPWSQEFAPERK